QIGPGEIQHGRKAVFGRFRAIRAIVVLTGRLRDKPLPRPSAKSQRGKAPPETTRGTDGPYRLTVLADGWYIVQTAAPAAPPTSRASPDLAGTATGKQTSTSGAS